MMFRRVDHPQFLTHLRNKSSGASPTSLVYMLARHYTALVQCSNIGCLFHSGYMSYDEYYCDRLRACRRMPPKTRKPKNNYCRIMMKYGTANEANARQQYQRAFPDASITTGGLYHHKEYNEIAGSPDFLVHEREQVILGEIKCRWQQRKYHQLVNVDIKPGWLLQVMGTTAVLRSRGIPVTKVHFVHWTHNDFVVQEILWTDMEGIWNSVVLPQCLKFIDDLHMDLLPDKTQGPTREMSRWVLTLLQSVPKKVIFRGSQLGVPAESVADSQVPQEYH